MMILTFHILLAFWIVHIILAIILFHSHEHPNFYLSRKIDGYFKKHRQLEKVVGEYLFPITIIYVVIYYIFNLFVYKTIVKVIKRKEKQADEYDYDDYDGLIESRRPKSIEDMAIDTSLPLKVLIPTSIGFTVEDSQIICIENEYDEHINKYIQDNLFEIRLRCHLRGVDFVYMPQDAKRFLRQDYIKYACPWVKDADLADVTPQDSSWIMKYVNTMNSPMVYTYDEHNDTFYNLCPPAKYIKPGFIVSTSRIHGDEERGFYHVYAHIPIVLDDIHNIKDWINDVINEIGNSGIYYKTQDPPEEGEAEDTFDEQSLQLMEEIREKVEMLRSFGISEAVINDLFQQKQKLSRMVITTDWRIILPDYNNMEIEMTALPKAVFFLFLRHPEGIVFKELADYRRELAFIYNKLTNRSDNEAVQKSIEDITNPLKNSINEKCARIREAFISKFSETLAENYFVTGHRGTPKKISLDRSLVTWEKDLNASVF